MAVSKGTSTTRTLRRWAWLPLGLAAGTYLAGPRLLRRAFAPPRRETNGSPEDLGLVSEQVWLDSVNGVRLHGWFIPVDGRAPAVVVLHGWGGNASLMLPLAPHLHAAGFHSLFLDARNHGFSDHDRFTSMPRFAEDLEVAVDWLRGKPLVSSVGAVGHSVGAGATILVASRGDRLDAVVSVASPADPGRMMRAQMSRLPGPAGKLILGSVERMVGMPFESFAPRRRISDVNAPVLLVHGEDDRVVPLGDLRELASAQPEAEVSVIPGAGHSDLAPFEDHLGGVIEFLGRHLSR